MQRAPSIRPESQLSEAQPVASTSPKAVIGEVSQLVHEHFLDAKHCYHAYSIVKYLTEIIDNCRLDGAQKTGSAECIRQSGQAQLHIVGVSTVTFRSNNEGTPKPTLA